MSMTDLGGEPSATGRDEKSSPKQMAAGAIGTVKEEAASFAETAKGKVSEKVAEGTAATTQTLGVFATAIREAGDKLAQQDQSLAGRVVRQAADGLESFSRSIGDKRPEELLEAVRGFGRNNPAAFIAGSVLLGIALGRVVKSTEQRQAGSGSPMPAYRNPTEYLGDGSSSLAQGSSFDDGSSLAGSSSPEDGMGLAGGTGMTDAAVEPYAADDPLAPGLNRTPGTGA